MKSPWKKYGINIAQTLGIYKNPAKYIYNRANRYEVILPGQKYVGRFKTLMEALNERNRGLVV